MSDRMFHFPLDQNSTDQERLENLRYVGRLVEPRSSLDLYTRMRMFLEEQVIGPLYHLEDSLTRRGITEEDRNKQRIKWTAIGILTSLAGLAFYSK
ncbi:hypothetical protein HYT56_04375 [Candidatus Woesearchaeota archaeon]|nr:hypothetical protein [Candidatus Woesearchaeota archaeon]